MIALPLTCALGLGVTVLRDARQPAASAFLFALLAAIVAALAALACRRAVALVAALAVPALPLALAWSEPAIAAEALRLALTSPLLWGTLAWPATGVLILWLAGRSAARVRCGRLVAYAPLLAALASAGLAAWWLWGGPQARLTVLPGLAEPDRRGVALVPATLLIGAMAQLAVGALLPPDRRRRLALADLLAQFWLLAVPFVALYLARRAPSRVERQYSVSWLALLLLLLVALRAALALAQLARAADEERLGDRRLALALLAVCLAVYWPVGAWRGSALGLTGDEPQYLATTINLRERGDLELTRAIFRPEMAALAYHPPGDIRADIHEDQSRDRMSGLAPVAPGTALYLPLVGGPGLGAKLDLFNPGLEDAGATVIYRDEAGAEVETQATTVGPGKTVTLRAPTARGGWLGAAVEAGKPVVATVRLSDPAGGEELYGGAVAVASRCLPLRLAGVGWDARLLVQNALPAGALATWRHLGADGTAIADGQVELPARGLATLPVGPIDRPGTICVAADGPVAALVLGRAERRLLALQTRAAQATRVTIPTPPATFSGAGQLDLLVFNPGATPVSLRISRGPYSADVGATVPARGTWAFPFLVGAWHRATDHYTGWLLADQPVVVAMVPSTGAHTAALAPPSSQGTALHFPVSDADAGRLTLAQLDLTNVGPEETDVTVEVHDATGDILRLERLRLCGSCTRTFPLWLREPGRAMLTVRADEPLLATLLQREVRTAYPFHSLGLSVVLLPGYALGGYRGALATAGLLGALLAVALYWLLRRAGVGRRASLLTAALPAFSPPLVVYSAQLYPEVGGAALLVGALVLADRGLAGRRWSFLPMAACLIAVPLFHSRLLPLALLVAGSVLVALGLRSVRAHGAARVARSPASWLVAGLVAAGLLAGGALLVRFDPRLRPDYVLRHLSPATAGPFVLGVLLDRASGLLPGVPVFACTLSGFGWAIRQRTYLGLTALAVAAAQVLLVAMRTAGWEVWAPPARYALPAVPFLALALGAAWEQGLRRPVRWLAVALLAWGLLIGLLYCWLPLSAYFNILNATWYAAEIYPRLLGANPLDLFPAFSSQGPAGTGKVLTWLAILVATALLGVRWPVARNRA